MTRPTETTPVVHAPKLDVLPTQGMAWENFEVLLYRLAREVRGLRQVRRYGVKGQSQYGIDIVGRVTDNTAEAIQSKKYVKFTKSDLTEAVSKFIEKRGELPFPVTRLIVAAGCDADRTEITEELYRLNDENTDIDIELWDRRTVCEMLRNRRDIVTEFFSEAAADAFCLPGPPHVISAPSTDNVALADALLHGPAVITGAEKHLTEVARLESAEPGAAARSLQQAEELLTAGGFAAHASVLTRRRADLLARAGEDDAAVELLSEHFWQAVDVHDVHEADLLERALTTVSRSGGPHLLANLAKAALEVIHHPLQLPHVNLDEFADESVRVESARLMLLMAETANVEPANTWTQDNVALLLASADAIESPADGTSDHRMLAYRLRIEAADAVGEWTPLVVAARRRKVSRQIAALILARHAMHLAEHGEFDEADASWEEAIEQACLDGQNDAAAEWVHSRRILFSKHRGFSSDLDDFPRLVRSLRAVGGDDTQRVVRRLERDALQALVDEKPHVAVPTLRAFLRFAYAAGSWGQVQHARVLLADAYQRAGEIDRSIALLIVAAQAKKAEQVAQGAGDHYLDVRTHLRSPAYWIPATAFRVLAEQADLIPDDQVDEIAVAAVEILRRADAGVLRDSAFFSPFVYLEALKVLAALSGRLTEQQAREVLGHLRPLVPRKPYTYRHSDDSHVRACVGIATAHPTLRHDAIQQLLDLLAVNDSGVSQEVERRANELFTGHTDIVRDRLATLASQDNPFAAALLDQITDEPSTEQLSAAQAASVNLTAPLQNTANSFGIGTDAVRQSLLAGRLSKTERRKLVYAQLERVKSPYELGNDRADYYRAAANLAHDLDDTDDLFEQTMELANDPTPSTGDLLANIGNHPLGTFRTSGMTSDTRPHALLLAAALARTDTQKTRVRDHGISLLGSSNNAGWYVVRALQIIAPEDLTRDVPLLATQHDWAARSLAAITWATSSPKDTTVGMLLASDQDPRVRRALADALRRTADTAAIAQVKDKLHVDPRFSVRKLLREEPG